MTTETNPQPDTQGLSAEDIQQLAQQGYATRARDKIFSAIFRGVIPDIREFSEDERQTFWAFFPLTKQTDGRLPDAEELYSDEQLLAACDTALASRKQVTPIPINAYDFAKQHTLKKLLSETDTLNGQLGMWDAYVESGKLPSSKQLKSDPILHGLWAEAFEMLEEVFHLDDAAKAWNEAQQRYSQYLIEQSKKARGTSTETTISKSSLNTQQHNASGRPRSACNLWAIEQFEQGKGIRQIQDEYTRRYNEEKSDNATPPRKDLQRVYSEWLKRARNS